jgi:transcriptional regulator with XRE-family HTH domain
MSELWQRLRAGRELARKTHADVAMAVGLTHANAVASWEASDPSERAQPLARQVLRVAKLCGLPAYLLIDDAVSVEEIISFKGL